MEQPGLKQQLDLNGKVAIVTGGAKGIGQGIASTLAAAGAAVLITDIDLAAAQKTAEQIKQAGGKAAALQADSSSVSDAARVAQAAVDTFGRLDIMVNNAGIFPPSPVMDITEAQWDKVLDINLKGAFFYAQAAAKKMIAQGNGGRIINIASVDALLPSGNLAHYDASKGGLAMLTRSMAKELGAHQILVNAIAPGAIETPGAKKVMSQILGKDVPADTMPVMRTVLGRNGQPDDIAGAVYYLSCGLSSYVTGSLLVVDGGYMLV